jgi:hypothetical protein
MVGSTPTTPATPLGEAAVLASDDSGDLHLIWHGRRFAVRDPEVVLAAFAWRRQEAHPVAPAVLNALPAGLDLRRMTIAGAGRRSPVESVAVGEVVVVENSAGGRRFAVARPDGLADITQVQADLLLASGAGAPHRVDPAVYAAAPRSTPLVPTGPAAPPPVTPALRTPGPGGSVCVTLADGGPAAVGVIAGSARTPDEIVGGFGGGFGGGEPGGAAGVDRVAVPPGRAAVVAAVASASAPDGPVSLVSEVGLRHPIPSPEVLAALGYAEVRPQRLPAAVVAALPAGPALDPDAARRPVAPS